VAARRRRGGDSRSPLADARSIVARVASRAVARTCLVFRCLRRPRDDAWRTMAFASATRSARAARAAENRRENNSAK
jgi:hypothetical protein